MRLCRRLVAAKRASNGALELTKAGVVAIGRCLKLLRSCDRVLDLDNGRLLVVVLVETENCYTSTNGGVPSRK